MSLGLSLLIGACTSSYLGNRDRGQGLEGPQGPEEGSFRRQRWLVPTLDSSVMMSTTVWRPKGSGPFPIAVIGHASTQMESERIDDPTPRYQVVAEWLVRHGYAAVLPVRPGHGKTGETYLEDQGGCDDADYLHSGRATADSIQAALEYMLKQQFARKGDVIVVGQSAGGWGALAVASRNPPTVRAIINFAGGRGGRPYGEPNTNCAPDRLIAAAADFGRSARIPTLWIYSQNDSFFSPDLSKQMADAFRRAGGLVEYHLVPPFSKDGHLLLFAPEATAVWSPLVERFIGRSSR
jgi:dienelactone hydrolase